MSAVPTRVFRTALAVSALLVSGAVLQPHVAAQGQSQDRVDVIIGFRSPAGPLDEGLVRGLGGRVNHTYQIIPAIAASLPPQAIAALENNPRVDRIEPDGRVFADSYETELSAAWGIGHIGAGALHAASTFGSAAVKVAVIDSGIACNHPDLIGQCGPGFDFVNDDMDPYDDDSHGTHVAGTIAAARNMQGVVGVAPGVTLIPLKVLDATGSGSFSDVIAAVQWAVTNGLHVTNNSYGSSQSPGSLVEDAFNAAASAGVLHIASAGNSGRCNGRGDQVGYPARYASVVAVAATSQSDSRACFSSVGPDVEISAPGVGINSTIPDSGYAQFNGTSMASPHVAGVAALVLSVAGLTDQNGAFGRADEARAILQATAHDLGSGGRDSQYGYGLVDALAAVTAAGGTLEPPDDAVNVQVSMASSFSTADDTANVSVTVTDEAGQPITGLGGGAFSATIDGNPAGITFGGGAGGVYTVELDISALSVGGPYTLMVHVTEAVTSSGSASFSISAAPTGNIDPTISYVGYGGKDANKHFTVTVNLAAGGAPVANASVTIDLTRDSSFFGTASGTTDGAGNVSFSSTNPPSGTYSTNIVSISAPGGLTWNGVTPANAFVK